MHTDWETMTDATGCEMRWNSESTAEIVAIAFHGFVVSRMDGTFAVAVYPERRRLVAFLPEHRRLVEE